MLNVEHHRETLAGSHAGQAYEQNNNCAAACEPSKQPRSVNATRALLMVRRARFLILEGLRPNTRDAGDSFQVGQPFRKLRSIQTVFWCNVIRPIIKS